MWTVWGNKLDNVQAVSLLEHQATNHPVRVYFTVMTGWLHHLLFVIIQTSEESVSEADHSEALMHRSVSHVMISVCSADCRLMFVFMFSLVWFCCRTSSGDTKCSAYRFIISQNTLWQFMFILVACI